MVTSDEWGELYDALLELCIRDGRVWFRTVVRHDRRSRSYFTLGSINDCLGVLMAKSSKPGRALAGGKSGWQTVFVDIPLSGVTMEEIDSVYAQSDTVYDGLEGLLGSQYRVGFAYNVQNDAVICSVTCKDEDGVNSGKTFTSFAGTWYDALRVSLYKHYVICEEKWPGEGSKSGKVAFG